MKREIHLRELQLLDAVRRRFMHHQQTLKETELQRLDDEIERKVSERQNSSEIPDEFNERYCRTKSVSKETVLRQGANVRNISTRISANLPLVINR